MEFIARILATMIWLVIGLLLWVPLIARTALSLTLVYLRAAIERGSAPDLSLSNRAVFSFYTDGISWIWSDSGKSNSTKDEKNNRWEHFFGAIFTAVIFWGPVIGLYFLSGSTQSHVEDHVPSGNAHSYAGLIFQPVVGVGCKLFKGCSGESQSGNIEIKRVSFRDNVIMSDEILLDIEMCMNDLYKSESNKRISAYFADTSGNTIEWMEVDAGNILDGQCKTIVLETEDNGDWGRVDIKKGTYFVTLGNKKYQSVVQ